MSRFNVGDEFTTATNRKYLGSAVLFRSKVIATFDNREEADKLGEALNNALEPFLESATYIG